MKKIIVPLLVLATVSVGAFAGVSKREAKAAITASDLANLLTSYNDGGYTKKTQFFLNDETRAETQYFHAGANVAKRATYYNEAEDTLLIGDYDGTFTSINSGYRNVEGGAQHFTYKNAATPSASDLFAQRNDGWTAAGQSINM